MSQLVGTISQIIGPVVDVKFDGSQGELPRIYEALEVTKSTGQVVILEVQKHVGQDTVRAISMDSLDGCQRGQEVRSKGDSITMPIGDQIYGRAEPALHAERSVATFRPGVDRFPAHARHRPQSEGAV